MHVDQSEYLESYNLTAVTIDSNTSLGLLINHMLVNGFSVDDFNSFFARKVFSDIFFKLQYIDLLGEDSD